MTAGSFIEFLHLARHSHYRIEGRDLHADLPVSLKDAALGAKVAVDTPAGRVAAVEGGGAPHDAAGEGIAPARTQPGMDPLLVEPAGNCDPIAAHGGHLRSR